MKKMLKSTAFAAVVLATATVTAAAAGLADTASVSKEATGFVCPDGPAPVGVIQPKAEGVRFCWVSEPTFGKHWAAFVSLAASGTFCPGGPADYSNVPKSIKCPPN